MQFRFSRWLASLGMGPRTSRPSVCASRTRRTARLALESLEARRLLATFTVVNTLDSGVGSLRQAIMDANGSAAGGTIAFNIPVTDSGFIDVDAALPGGDASPDVWRIQPLSELPALMNAGGGIVVDGRTQTTLIGDVNPFGPEIVLDGNGGAGAGLTVLASHSAIYGLDIQRFGSRGLHIEGVNDVVVAGNYLGTNATGAAAAGNTTWGVRIANSTNVIVGGNTAADRNLISGNQQGGLYVIGSGSIGNQVLGNYIGVDRSGLLDLGNTFQGIYVGDGTTFSPAADGAASNTLIRGNVVSGNNTIGIEIKGSGATGNLIQGNFIGTDATGTAAVANTQQGIHIHGGAAANLVGTNGDGTSDTAERNVISGNALAGIVIDEPGTNDNVVAGNYIGTNITGTAALGNAHRGVDLFSGAQFNRIGTNADGTSDTVEGNLISGNGWEGISFSSADTSFNVAAGNLIGTDLTGTIDLGNVLNGVVIFNGASSNTIGGSAGAATNVISGNNLNGVRITGAGTSNNIVSGNRIGTVATGNLPLPNSSAGVILDAGATNNWIGANGDGVADAIEGNLISGNGTLGVRITGAGTSFNVVAGNLIGTNAAGTGPLANGTHGVSITAAATFNIVGTNGDGVADNAERNVISGNTSRGVLISDAGTDSNVIAGNYLGLTAAGTAALSNTLDGILIQAGAKSNRIGTDGNGKGDAAERNVIAANGGAGINIIAADTTLNIVAGNLIGTNLAGATNLGNTNAGVRIQNSASNNVIGGSTPARGNTIAFNKGGGITMASATSLGNSILGNAMFNNSGVGIDLAADGATPNDAGDADTGANNLQNSPDIAAAVLIGKTLTVRYSIATLAANATYPLRVEFFKADSDGQEGQTLLGADTYAASDATSTRDFISLQAVSLADGDLIVATATDAAGNTSEFSTAIVLERRVNPWHNPVKAGDVTGDKHSVAGDALAVINFINAFGALPVPIDAPEGPFFYDVSDDGFVSAVDALIIINNINAGIDAEGEPPSAALTNDLADSLFAVLVSDATARTRRRT